MKFKRVLTFVLAVAMVLSLLPMTAFAANVGFVDSSDGYYNVISKNDYDIAPGIVESEIVLNNDDGTRRQVLHVMEADVTNPYVTVIPSSKGMIPTPGKYGVQIMSEQAAWAEANGYGNVVGAMNISLSWYDSEYYDQHPELVGEPLGYLILNGEYYANSRGKTSGAQTCLVINYDEKDGEARPVDIPKTQIRSTADPITGWEEQVIPANFGFLVKNGVAVNTTEGHTGGASRSMLGIKEDGTIVMVMNDGRQSPYSEGLNDYEMSQVMLSLGCVYAINGDGGGSSTFLSQRPGEELKLNCSPSDGAERPTTHGVLMISTAPATGEFVRASISSANDYYTPGSSVQFNAIGTDLVGTSAEVPDDVVWKLVDDSFGTISHNGLFVSNGKIGDVTVQMTWNGEVVGEDTVHIVIPDSISLGQASITAPYGRNIQLNVIATYDSKNVVIKDGDVSLALSNAEMGKLSGNVFTATDDTKVTSGTITATFVGTEVSITVDVVFGRGSEILFDFEGEDAADGWKQLNSIGVAGDISAANKENGQVRFGNGSLAVTTDYSNSKSTGGWIYFGMNTTGKDIIIPAEAISWGIWVYVPEEAVGGEVDFRPYHKIGDTYSRIDLVLFGNGYATTFDESGWHYVSVDISSLGELVIPGETDSVIANGQSKAFIEIYNPDTANTDYNYVANDYKSINGRFTYYFDDMTIDFSSAVDDREEPVFSYLNAAYGELDESVAVDGQTITYSDVIFSAKAAENTSKANYTGLDFSSAKAYVDGIDVTDKLSVGPDGSLALAEMTLADGVHTVKFAINDNAGNSASIVRQINVNAGSDMATVKVVPKDSTLDKILIGSLYYMNVVATDVEKVKEVVVKIDINNINDWEPQGMVVADGFEATCTVDAIDEIATIVIEKIGSVDVTGEAVLVSLPARTWVSRHAEYDATLTPESLWASKFSWSLDLQFTVKYGKLTQTDNTESSFSAAKHYVDTENYAMRYTATPEYWTSKTSWHVHTAEVIDDLDATCTKAGYTGRTFCEGCNSVVDWGTVVPATGHSWVANGVITSCEDCDAAISTDGLTGWQNIDGADYYFTENSEVVDGKYTVDGHTYTFSNSLLVDAAWENVADYTVCWWAGQKVENTWFTIGDKTYYFVMDQMCTGIQKVAYRDENGNRDGYRYYAFAENGVWMEDYSGFYSDGVNSCWLENGVAVYKGLCQDEDGNYYYMNSAYLAVKNCTYSISEAKANGLFPAGKYEFDADGKMIIKNGIVKGSDGEIRYYVDGAPTYAGLVYENGNYYYFGSDLKAARNCERKISRHNDLLPYGSYTFDENGIMVNPNKGKNGIVKDPDGEIRYYVDGVATYAGLVYENGNYYYFGSDLKAARNCERKISRHNDLLPYGSYTFDENGVMVNPPAMKEGIVKDPDGEIRYYVDGVATYAGLVYENGNYYYFGSDLKAARNRERKISRHNDLLPYGTYTFDENGVMVNPPVEG